MIGLSVMEHGVLRDIVNGTRMTGTTASQVAGVLQKRGFIDRSGNLTPAGQDVIDQSALGYFA